MASWASMDNEGRGRLSTGRARRLTLRVGMWVQLRNGWIVGPINLGKNDPTVPWYCFICGHLLAWDVNGKEMAGSSEARIIRTVPAPATPNQARGPRSTS